MINSTQWHFLQPSGHVGHIIQPLLTADHKVHVDLALEPPKGPKGTTQNEVFRCTPKQITGNQLPEWNIFIIYIYVYIYIYIYLY